MKIHDVKSWPEFFSAIEAGHRHHELRRNDRGYAVGDRMILREFDPQTNNYTGRELWVKITSMTSSAQKCAVSDEGLHDDFCIMSVEKWEFNPFEIPKISLHCPFN